ncbi:DUF4177 domain-containing protein [Halococcus sp. PRR34]|uniref:DUF4177 domain-containing protein n=1 Tax=Halococcus sp. PRR34 TaxID=3020830 RepID=UPI00235FB6D1|nr:DUF4177 domain-containing protein [Halococcus sp. PRR34]
MTAFPIVNPRRSESTETLWEYETLRPPRGETRKESEDPKAEMNELATEGWRLIETVDYTGGGTKFLVFERPARSDEDNATDQDSS